MKRYRGSKRAFEGQGDGSVVKGLMSKHKDLSSISRAYIKKKKNQACWHVPVIPVLARWRQKEPWGSLADQPNQMSELLVK